MAIGESVVLGENRDRWTLATELGAKRGLESADPSLDLEPQFGRSLGEQAGSENFLEPELRMLVDFVAERDHLVTVIINRAGYFGVSVHQCAPLEPYCTVSSTEDSDYPTRRSANAPRGVSTASNTATNIRAGTSPFRWP